MHGRYEKCIQHFGWEPEGKDNSEDLCADGNTIL
jgi:hypothetical protein